MKILAINCKPDLSYFTKRGLVIDVEYKTIDKIFPIYKIGSLVKVGTTPVDYWTIDVEQYLKDSYPEFKYSIILVGWKPSDYSNLLNTTGGLTNLFPLPNGTIYSTIRQDSIPNNNYAIHELSHALVKVVRKTHWINDYMDTDKLNRQYYLNEYPDNPDSNFAQTWNEIKPYLLELNNIKYETMPTVTLERTYNWGKETVGKLTYGDFTCNTLELAWNKNLQNISSIPTGEYICKWTWSTRLLKYTYEVMGVPNRSGIRIHSANLYTQILGCLALGMGYSDINNDKLPDVLNSRVTVDKFNALMGKKDFKLIIK